VSRCPVFPSLYAAIFVLLDGGAFINSKDRDCRTPLSHAEMSGHKGVVKLLLDRGADQQPAVEAFDTPKQLPMPMPRLEEHTNVVDEIATNSTKKKGKRSSTWFNRRSFS
jgi:ankyrin repeat protein